MRIIRFRTSDGRVILSDDQGDGDGTVVLDADGILGPRQADLADREMLRGKHAKVADAIRASDNGHFGPLVRTVERVRTAEKILAPMVPRDILCVGRNYRDPERDPEGEPGSAGDLELFMKPRSAVQDPGGPIRIPPGDPDPDIDVEGELAVVIGSEARNVAEADALGHVLGYVAANDVTARRWRRGDVPMTWMRGKGFDTFCPIGPAIATPDELSDPASLAITTSVNGRIVRRGNTSQMIRTVARLISEISRVITLGPGTLLLTGAPPPVSGRPMRGLRDGDEVCVEIEGVGRLVNTVTSSQT